MSGPSYLTPLQQVAAVVGAVGLFVLVVILIYRRRLREDYAALWFAVAVLTVVFAFWQEGLRLVALALDAVTLTAPIFLLSIMFLALIAIHFSVRLSEQDERLRALAREIALLRGDRPAAQSDLRSERERLPSGE